MPLALPVTLPVKAPANVPDNTSVFELNVSPLAVFGPKSPVAAVTNNGKQVVSVDSSATVIVVGTKLVDALPSSCVCMPDVTPSKYPISVEVTADTDTSPLPSDTNALDAVKFSILENAIAALALTSSFTMTPLPIDAVPVTFPVPSKEPDV